MKNAATLGVLVIVTSAGILVAVFLIVGMKHILVTSLVMCMRLYGTCAI